MKKYIPSYIYGAVIICTGIFLLILHYYLASFYQLRITFGAGLIFGAFLAFITAFSIKQKQVQLAYNEMHALIMLVYGLFVLIFCNSLEKLIYVTDFLIFFYTFLEIVFCARLFDLEQKVVLKILIVRIILGFFTGIGMVIIMQPGILDIDTLVDFGVFFILVGITIFLYVPILNVGHLIGNKNSVNIKLA